MIEHEFGCPECAGRIEIDDPMREAILRNGCPICSAPVDREYFASA